MVNVLQARPLPFSTFSSRSMGHWHTTRPSSVPSNVTLCPYESREDPQLCRGVVQSQLPTKSFGTGEIVGILDRSWICAGAAAPPINAAIARKKYQILLPAVLEVRA